MPIFLHPSWILGSGSGHRTPASTVLVPRTVEIVPHSISFFCTGRNWFSPSGHSAMLRAHAQVIFILTTNTISKIFYFPKQSSLEVQPAYVVSRLVISHSATPKHFSLDQVQHFLFVSMTIPKLLSQLWGVPSVTLKLLLKMGNSKKTKNQGMYLLDEGPHLQSDLDAPLNSVSVYLMCDIIDFITFCFVIQDVLSHMQ